MRTQIEDMSAVAWDTYTVVWDPLIANSGMRTQIEDMSAVVWDTYTVVWGTLIANGGMRTQIEDMSAVAWDTYTIAYSSMLYLLLYWLLYLLLYWMLYYMPEASLSCWAWRRAALVILANCLILALAAYSFASPPRPVWVSCVREALEEP
jgi:hypothetical protein